VKRDALAKFVLATIVLLVPRNALSQNLVPLSIAREGYVYAEGKYSTLNSRQVMSGQLMLNTKYRLSYYIRIPLLWSMEPGVRVSTRKTSGESDLGRPVSVVAELRLRVSPQHSPFYCRFQ
jgi:hypothetical protein